MRAKHITYKRIGVVDLPEDLADQVSLLLHDPAANRMRYGAMRALCEKLFGNWVEEQSLALNNLSVGDRK